MFYDDHLPPRWKWTNMLRTIEAATPHENLVLLITFSCGETVLVDLADLPGKGGVLASLADPGFFALVAVGEGGRFLEWPLDLDASRALPRRGAS
jgi:hypothetical protein